MKCGSTRSKTNGLRKAIEDLPNVVFGARAEPDASARGSIAYVKTAEDNDAFVWVAPYGTTVSESPITILRAAACSLGTPPQGAVPLHDDLVRQAVSHVVETEKSVGGGLGRPSGARFRATNG